MPDDRNLTVRLELERWPELSAVLEATVELATKARELVDFVPGDVSPVVLTRARVDALVAPLEALEAAAAALTPDPQEASP